MTQGHSVEGKGGGETDAETDLESPIYCISRSFFNFHLVFGPHLALSAGSATLAIYTQMMWPPLQIIGFGYFSHTRC